MTLPSDNLSQNESQQHKDMTNTSLVEAKILKKAARTASIDYLSSCVERNNKIILVGPSPIVTLPLESNAVMVKYCRAAILH